MNSKMKRNSALFFSTILLSGISSPISVLATEISTTETSEQQIDPELKEKLNNKYNSVLDSSISKESSTIVENSSDDSATGISSSSKDSQNVSLQNEEETTLSSSIEPEKKEEQTQTFNNVTPRYSVGQTVNLMDQNTKKTWNITIEKDFYQVNQYLGRNLDTNVVIPTEMNIVLSGTKPTKKPVRLNGGSTKFMQNATGNSITSFRVEGNNAVLVNGVEGFKNFFRNSSIENIDLTGLNVNVINSIDFSNMFQDCSNLKNIKFGANNFNNVTNTSRMFSGCTSLQTIDLSMWNTNKSSLNMSYMFENTPALRKIDLRNIPLDNQNTERILGDKSTNKSAINQPLVVIVNPDTSSKLLNYDFVTQSGRIPESFPILDANGGIFSAGNSTLKYIEKICVTPSQLEISTFNAWKEQQIPTKKGNVFVDWQPSKDVDNAQSVLDLLDVTYTAIFSDWRFELTSDKSKYLLTEYVGGETNIVVPATLNGMPTVLKDIDSTVIPNYQDVTSFKIGGNVSLQNTNLTYAFRNWSNLQEVDLNGLDTSNVTSMVRMFEFDAKLQNVNVNNLNTSNVNDMGYLFRGCSSLKTIDLNNWNVSNVNDMNSMFKNCFSLGNIDLNNWDVSGVTDMSYMFFNCTGLTELDLSNWKASNLTTVNRMFNGAYNLKLLYLNNFVTTSSTDMTCMFYGPEHHQVIVTNDSNLLGYNYSSDGVTPIDITFNANDGTFSDGTNTKKYFDSVAITPDEANKKLAPSGVDQFKKDNIPTKTVDKRYTVFDQWNASKDTTNFKNIWDYDGVVYTAEYISSDWKFELTSDKEKYLLTEYVGGETNVVVPATLNGMPTVLKDIDSTVIPNYQDVTSFRIGGNITLQDNNLYYAFRNWSNLQEVDLSGLDTSNVIDMTGMFEYDAKLQNVNVNNLNTSNVNDMGYLFRGCSSLQNININNWDVSNVTGLNNMFRECSSLQNININNWDVSNVTNMNSMFFNCTGLTELDLSNWRTPKLTSVNRMFNGTNNLKLLYLNDFITTNNTDMTCMFYGPERKMLVITNDSNLLNYNYSSDYIKQTGPTFCANGGTFSNNQDLIYYFDSCAIRPDDSKLDIATFSQFKKDLKPTKEKAIFKDWQVVGKDSTTNVLDLLDTEYLAEWNSLEINPPSPDDNVVSSTTSEFGIAYMPKTFDTSVTALYDRGSQNIQIAKNRTFNVGVRDLRNTANTWSLKAQLVWDQNKELKGSFIQTTNNSGTVMKNINDGVESFDPSKDLVSSNNEVQGGKDVTITSTQSETIMTANPVNHDAVYDYELGDVSLEIPETKIIKPGEYSGHVEWNLSDAP
ncbi:BspA family leucine-rich repeat surface protein [Enterococcus faecium]|uniref:BspA family leucine-rich repeat surface protein n=1 Tax=Enterococcus faecium TaxID=1352 RepID=UPI0039A5E97A